MADRRMFSKRVTDSARFLKMPVSTQCLYFHLGLHADDDGVVEAYPVINSIGASEDDLRVLVAKNFVIVLNEELVTYITDWTENNKIRADRKIDSIYKPLLLQVVPNAQLQTPKERADVKKNKAMDDQWTSNGQPMDGIGKDRIGKDSIDTNKQRKSQNPKLTQQEFVSMCREFTSDEDVIDLLIAWNDNRNLSKNPLTKRALEIALNKLEDCAIQSGLSLTGYLEEIVMKGWQGFYPIANAKQTEKPSPKREYILIGDDTKID